MSKTIQILGGVLVLQLALAAYLVSRDGSLASFKATEPLLTADLASADKVVIEDGDKKTLTLAKVNGEWQLPETFDFPASAEKVRETVKKFTEFKQSWPAGQTMIAAKQFNVTDDGFERRITLTKGDSKLATVYVGTSPSFRKVHVRVDDQPQTFAVEFNAYDVPVSVNDWYERDYYKLERAKIQQVTFGDVTFEHKEGNFVLTGLGENEQTDTSKSSGLVGKILNPRFEAVVGKTDTVKPGDKAFSYTVTTDRGEAVFTYHQPASAVAKKEDESGSEKDETLWLTISSRPYVFSVKADVVSALSEIDRSAYITEKAAADATEGTETSDGAQAATPEADTATSS